LREDVGEQMGRSRASIVEDFVKANRQELQKRWLESVLALYPEDSIRFLRNTEDRFKNPLGYSIAEMVEGVMGLLEEGGLPEDLRTHIFPVVQIRAVQGTSPSETLAFIGALKRTFREVSRKGGSFDRDLSDGLDELSDALLLLSFDIYMQCREKLSEIKNEELKRNLFMLLKRSGMADVAQNGE